MNEKQADNFRDKNKENQYNSQLEIKQSSKPFILEDLKEDVDMKNTDARDEE